METQTRFPVRPILLVDDEEHAVKSFCMALNMAGITNTITCTQSENVAQLLEQNDIDVVLLDLVMPKVTGRDILAHMAQNCPEIPAIVLTGIDDIDSAVGCMQEGAFDYILKPVKRDRLLNGVRRAIEVRALRDENDGLARRFLTDDLDHPEVFERFVTKSSHLRKVFQYCEAIGRGSHPVLVSGETGTGKDLIPRTLHDLSGRSGDFVAVNVAGLDDNTFSDTLFGHTKGAFTGASDVRKGLIEQAAGGTIFLDEIGDLSMSSQVKLLRLLEQKEYFPLGADQPASTDARIIVATARELDDAVAKGEFRRDLFYRLHTHHVNLPPLRERLEDIPLLLDRFLEEAAKEFGKDVPTYHKELITLLGVYDFPGNVRELRAMVFDAVGRHKSRMLSNDCFREHICGNATQAILETAENPSGTSWLMDLPELPTLKEAGTLLVAEAMRRSEGNQGVAATLLGITRQALAKRLRRGKEDR